MRKTVITNSAGETEALAARIGGSLRGGEVIELVSDLGGGKTTFTRGLARGAGSPDAVASPTFTISKEYDAPRTHIYHFDFYRLAEPGLIKHELHDALEDNKAVVVVEWGDVVADVLPESRLIVAIESTGEQKRDLTLGYPDELAYLVESL